MLEYYNMIKNRKKDIMKEKVLRFIFILIVLVIISFAIFKIYEERRIRL